MVPVPCPEEGVTSPWPPELPCGPVEVSLTESFNADSPAAASGWAVPLSPGWQQLRGQEMRDHCPQGPSFAEKPQDPPSSTVLSQHLPAGEATSCLSDFGDPSPPLKETLGVWLTMVWGVQIVARVSDAVVNRLQQSNHVFL